jgi:hypothetical protein
LERSAELFWKDLHICWIVTPDKEHAMLEKWIRDQHYCVIPEGAIIPETEALFSVKGWYRQQLVKLAIAPRVTTAFYVTLDADVICTRPFSSGDFIAVSRVHQPWPCHASGSGGLGHVCPVEGFQRY